MLRNSAVSEQAVDVLGRDEGLLDPAVIGLVGTVPPGGDPAVLVDEAQRVAL